MVRKRSFLLLSFFWEGGGGLRKQNELCKTPHSKLQPGSSGVSPCLLQKSSCSCTSGRKRATTFPGEGLNSLPYLLWEPEQTGWQCARRGGTLVAKSEACGHDPPLHFLGGLAQPRVLWGTPACCNLSQLCQHHGVPSGASLWQGWVPLGDVGEEGLSPHLGSPSAIPEVRNGHSGCAWGEPGSVPSPGCSKMLGSQGHSQGRAQLRITQLWLPSPFLLHGVARAERAVPPDRAAGGNQTPAFSLTWRMLKTCLFLFFREPKVGC